MNHRHSTSVSRPARSHFLYTVCTQAKTCSGPPLKKINYKNELQTKQAVVHRLEGDFTFKGEKKKKQKNVRLKEALCVRETKVSALLAFLLSQFNQSLSRKQPSTKSRWLSAAKNKNCHLKS